MQTVTDKMADPSTLARLTSKPLLSPILPFKIQDSEMYFNACERK